MKRLTIALGMAVLTSLFQGGVAAAAGCGGYVNLAVWGCAPWDNNPPKAGVTPGYRAPAPKPIPAPKPVVGGRLIGNDSAGLIGNAGGTLISPGNKTGSTLISPGNKTGSTLISPGNKTGSTLISPGNKTGSSFR